MFYNFQCPALNSKIKSKRELEKKKQNARNVTMYICVHCYIRMQMCWYGEEEKIEQRSEGSRPSLAYLRYAHVYDVHAHS